MRKKITSKPLTTIMPQSEPIVDKNSKISLDSNEITMEKLFTEVVNKNASDLHISWLSSDNQNRWEIIDVGENL